MRVYQHNPDALPDDAFEPGAFRHLVAGNTGRLLDPRRTPVSIVSIRPEAGTFIVRIDDFEDRGATWTLPFEDVRRFQFTRGSGRAEPALVRQYRAIALKLNQPLSIDCDPDTRAATIERIRHETRAAAAWLDDHSAFLQSESALPAPNDRRGDARLAGDVQRAMEARGLWDQESAFAKQFVSGPHSGEVVRGHRIVLAELGLVPYDGTSPRDPAVFRGRWAKARRADHIIARLALIRALFSRLGINQVMLYRGMSLRKPWTPPRNATFVSATFSRAVAESHFDAGEPDAARVLIAQPVPIERLFMTFHETAAMNETFLEAEAVLLWNEKNTLF